MRFLTLALACVLACSLVAAGDRVQMKSGQTLIGKIVSETETDLKLETADGPVLLSMRVVDKIERGVINDETGRKRRGPEATPELLEWINTCIKQMASDDAGVRQSAMMAVRATGDAARPALKQAAESDNADLARTAQRLLAAAARAGIRPTARRSPERTSRRVPSLGGVELSEEQRPQVESVMQEFRDQQRQISESVRNGEIERSEAQTKLADLQAGLTDKLAGVLTEEQIEKYRAWRESSNDPSKKR